MPLETAEQLMVNRILASLDEHGSSDLILSVGNYPTLRVGDKLQALEEEQIMTPDFMQRLIETILSPEQLEILKKRKTLTIAYTFQSKARFKIGVFYQQGFLTAMLKLIPQAAIPLEQLGMPPAIMQVPDIRKGLVFVVGPFGSGRSTTITSLIDNINHKHTSHILTVERPVEFLHIDDRSIIEQVEVEMDVPTYEDALKFVVREDIDVVMVSEVTSSSMVLEMMALVASGRLVYANLDADSSVAAINQLTNYFIAHDQPAILKRLGVQISAIIAQRMLPRIGGGSVVAAEVVIPNEAVRSTIQQGNMALFSTAVQSSREEGLVGLDQSIAGLVKNGLVTVENAYEAALSKTNLQKLLEQ